MSNILPIYTFDHPILRKKLKAVEEINAEIAELAEQMIATMHNADGIGLAANQVGKNVAMTVIDVSSYEGFEQQKTLVLINPVIEAFSDEEIPMEEGCLSLPDLRADVVRPAQVQVRFYDVEMHEQIIEADRILARVIQHEVDHLNGIYFFERLSAIRRTLSQSKLKRIARGEIETEYPLFPNV